MADVSRCFQPYTLTSIWSRVLFYVCGLVCLFFFFFFCIEVVLTHLSFIFYGLDVCLILYLLYSKLFDIYGYQFISIVYIFHVFIALSFSFSFLWQKEKELFLIDRFIEWLIGLNIHYMHNLRIFTLLLLCLFDIIDELSFSLHTRTRSIALYARITCAHW